MDFDELNFLCFREDDDPYNPERLHDPYEQYLFHCISQRALQCDSPSIKNELPEIPEFIEKLLLPLPEVVEKSKGALSEIKDLFNLEVVEPKSVKSERNDVVLVVLYLFSFYFLLY